MSAPPVVSNSSPLIAFQQIGRLDLVHELVGPLIVPTAVSREIAPSVTRPDWIEVRGLAQPVASIVLRVSLGAGESEAISLAIERKARLLLLDDLAARRLALGLHLPIIGTLVELADHRRAITRPSLGAVDFLVFRRLRERVLPENSGRTGGLDFCRRSARRLGR